MQQGHDGRAEFEELVRLHRRALARYCRTLAGPTDGDDLMQDTLTRALLAFAQLRDRDRFLPWCRQIARNANVRRLQSRRPTEELMDAADGGVDVESQVVDGLTRRSALEAAFAAMPERSRLIVTARAEGTSAKVLAAELNVKPALVDTINARAKAKLRDLIAADHGSLLGSTTLLVLRPRLWSRRWVNSLASGDRHQGAAFGGFAALIAAAALTIVTGASLHDSPPPATDHVDVIAGSAQAPTAHGPEARNRGLSARAPRRSGRPPADVARSAVRPRTSVGPVRFYPYDAMRHQADAESLQLDIIGNGIGLRSPCTDQPAPPMVDPRDACAALKGLRVHLLLPLVTVRSASVGVPGR